MNRRDGEKRNQRREEKKCKCVYAISEAEGFLTRETLQHSSFIHAACLQSDILHRHAKPSEIADAPFNAASHHHLCGKFSAGNIKFREGMNDFQGVEVLGAANDKFSYQAR